MPTNFSAQSENVFILHNIHEYYFSLRYRWLNET